MKPGEVKVQGVEDMSVEFRFEEGCWQSVQVRPDGEKVIEVFDGFGDMLRCLCALVPPEPDE